MKMKVTLISKKSNLEAKSKRSLNGDPRSQEEHDLIYRTNKIIVDTFRRAGVDPVVRDRESYGASDFIDQDIIIVNGGDGTALDVASYVFDDTKMLFVKASGGSYGAHCTSSFDTVESDLERFLKGDYSIEKRVRLKTTMPDGKVDYALNDLHFGIKYIEKGARVKIINGDLTSRVSSNGIVASTYAGKTGWFDFIPICNPERVWDAEFREDEKSIGRYKSMISHTVEGNAYGRILPGQGITLVNESRAYGKVAIDGDIPEGLEPRYYFLEQGDEVKVDISDKPIHVVRF